MPACDHRSIRADVSVDLLITRYPCVVPVFIERRMHCVGCPMARFETLTDVCTIYGQPLEPLLTTLRAAVQANRQYRDARAAR